MRFLIVNRFFGGAQIPTGRMAEDVARVLVEGGHEVTALASTGTYAGAEKRAQQGACPPVRRAYGSERSMERGATEQRSEVGGQRSENRGKEHGALRVETVRVPKWMPRALAWLWFTWQARQRMPRMDWDVCVLMTDPPLLPLLAARAKARGQATGNRGQSEVSAFARSESGVTTKRRTAVWLMDLYPEALAASGRLGRNNPLYKWYFDKRQRALAAAELLICLGQSQKELLDAGGIRQTANSIRPTQIAVVPPWDDRGNIALATEESLKDLALYAGNLGEAHAFVDLLRAVPFLPSEWKLRFAVRGAKSAALRKAVEESGASDQMIVSGYVSGDETTALLASARVHLITMSPGWEGIVVPSKLYGCIRTGRPVLFIGPENSDTAREIRAHDWGKVLPAGASGKEVAVAILELAARPTRDVERRSGAIETAALLESLAAA